MMITWKFALMMLFGISNSLPMQSAKEIKPKAEKASEAKVTEVKASEAKPATAQVALKKAEAPKVEAKTKVEVKNVIVAKADEPKVVLQEVSGIKIEIPKVELPKVAAPTIELRKVELPKVAVGAPLIKVEGIKVEPKVENVKVLLKKVEEPKAAVKAEGVKVFLTKVDPANPAATKTEAVDVVLTKVDPAKTITLKKLEGAPVTATGTITVTQADEAKTGTPQTFKFTQVTPKGEEVKKDGVKTAIIKSVSEDSKAHIIQVQVLPSGEVKIIQDGVQATATPLDAKALILKKLEAAKVGEETAKAVKSVVLAQAQIKADQAKAEIKSDGKSRTIELRIEITGDGPPKVEVIGSRDTKLGELKTDVRRVEGLRKIEEVRKVEGLRKVEEARKVEGRIVEAVKTAPAPKPNTASIVINGETKSFTLPGTNASGVMKLVISEDGKGFKIESDGKAKTEVLELQKVLQAADAAQAQAMTLRKKAEELRAQAMKEAQNAKELQLKYSGDMNEFNKKVEGRIVEARSRVPSDSAKIDQLNKRMEKIEKMIEELAKKVK